ncbi:MAG: mltG, partial [Aeromicrobium sp.]|nr:mltG [Aeromicrobium sp.]
MSNSGLDMMTDGARGPEEPAGAGRRRAQTPRRPPWGRRILALLIVAVVLVGIVMGGLWVKDKLFTSVEDYSGDGAGTIVVTIPTGADGQQIS